MHVAIIVAEVAGLDELEPHAPVEADRIDVRRQRIDQHRLHVSGRETARQCLPHHLAAMTSPARVGFADPDVDRTQMRRRIAPVMTILDCGADDLHEPLSRARPLRRSAARATAANAAVPSPNLSRRWDRSRLWPARRTSAAARRGRRWWRGGGAGCTFDRTRSESIVGR